MGAIQVVGLSYCYVGLFHDSPEPFEDPGGLGRDLYHLGVHGGIAQVWAPRDTQTLDASVQIGEVVGGLLAQSCHIPVICTSQHLEK